MFVGEARISDVIASRRLASDWLSDDIMWKCIGGYDSASAPLEPEEDARQSTLLFSPPHSGFSDSVTFDPPRAFSPSLAPSYLRSRRFGRSRSASFSSLSLLSRFSQLPPACPCRFLFFSPAENFFSAARTNGAPSSSISYSPLYTSSLSQIRSSILSFSSPRWNALPSSSILFPFDYNSHLTNIVSTLGAFGGNFGPGAPRKVPLWN